MIAAFKTTELNGITGRALADFSIEAFLLIDCENRIATAMAEKHRHTLFESRRFEKALIPQ